MIVRVRNMQPLGSSSLPVAKFLIEAGFTSPPLEVIKGTPLDEVINLWIESGIAVVIPVSEDEEAATAPRSRKRRDSVLTLDQARHVSEERSMQRTTSLPVGVPPAPEVSRRKAGSSALKSEVISLDAVREMKRSAINPASVPSVQAPPTPDGVPKSQTELDDLDKQASLVDVEADDAVSKDEAKQYPSMTDPDDDMPDTAATEIPTDDHPVVVDEGKAIDLESVTVELEILTKSVLMGISKSLGLEIRVAATKPVFVEAIAFIIVSQGRTVSEFLV